MTFSRVAFVASDTDQAHEGLQALTSRYGQHAPSDADVIVAISDGRVVDVGSHEELMTAKGVSHDLYMSQFRGGATPAKVS